MWTENSSEAPLSWASPLALSPSDSDPRGCWGCQVWGILEGFIAQLCPGDLKNMVEPLWVAICSFSGPVFLCLNTYAQLLCLLCTNSDVPLNVQFIPAHGVWKLMGSALVEPFCTWFYVTLLRYTWISSWNSVFLKKERLKPANSCFLINPVFFFVSPADSPETSLPSPSTSTGSEDYKLGPTQGSDVPTTLLPPAVVPKQEIL